MQAIAKTIHCAAAPRAAGRATGRPAALRPTARRSPTASAQTDKADDWAANDIQNGDVLCFVTYNEDDMMNASEMKVAAAHPDIFKLNDVPCLLTYSEDNE